MYCLVLCVMFLAAQGLLSPPGDGTTSVGGFPFPLPPAVKFNYLDFNFMGTVTWYKSSTYHACTYPNDPWNELTCADRIKGTPWKVYNEKVSICGKCLVEQYSGAGLVNFCANDGSGLWQIGYSDKQCQKPGTYSWNQAESNCLGKHWECSATLPSTGQKETFDILASKLVFQATVEEVRSPFPLPPGAKFKYADFNRKGNVKWYKSSTHHACTYPNDPWNRLTCADRIKGTPWKVYNEKESICGKCLVEQYSGAGLVNFCANDGSGLWQIGYSDKQCQKPGTFAWNQAESNCWGKHWECSTTLPSTGQKETFDILASKLVFQPTVEETRSPFPLPRGAKFKYVDFNRKGNVKWYMSNTFHACTYPNDPWNKLTCTDRVKSATWEPYNELLSFCGQCIDNGFSGYSVSFCANDESGVWVVKYSDSQCQHVSEGLQHATWSEADTHCVGPDASCSSNTPAQPETFNIKARKIVFPSPQASTDKAAVVSIVV